ncbi:MAG: hypothetical protein ABJA62_02980 [Luteimonas sp.]
MMRHVPGHERQRLPGWIRAWVYGAGGVCAASGMLWLLFHYFFQRNGAFGLEPHPLEHAWLVAHGTTGLVLLWVLGLIWLPHVRRGWAKPRHRLVGGAMAALMLWLGISAAGLYYLGDENWRARIAIAHWAFGLLAIVWLPLHIWLGRRTIRRQHPR